MGAGLSQEKVTATLPRPLSLGDRGPKELVTCFVWGSVPLAHGLAGEMPCRGGGGGGLSVPIPTLSPLPLYCRTSVPWSQLPAVPPTPPPHSPGAGAGSGAREHGCSAQGLSRLRSSSMPGAGGFRSCTETETSARGFINSTLSPPAEPQRHGDLTLLTLLVLGSYSLCLAPLWAALAGRRSRWPPRFALPFAWEVRWW